jgi:hypothetical protein
MNYLSDEIESDSLVRFKLHRDKCQVGGFNSNKFMVQY